jgi:hypothetical protein
MSEHPELAQTHALADGELAGEAAELARDHLATCELCQAELADVMQMQALPKPAALPANVVPIAWYRKRTTQLAGVLVAAAAAATIIYLGRRPTPGETPPPTRLALAEQRSLEARLAWDGAAGYRAYSPPRGSAAKETISLAVLAELEKRGDLHGVGALALLGGDYAQAAKYLQQGGGAGVLADRAALELGRGNAEAALALADQALDTTPGDGVASWNRALALRDLGLPYAAAQAFRAVARKQEPGWAAEATKRADELQRAFDDELVVYLRVADAAGKLDAGLSLDDARRVPGMARIGLYDAMRVAATPDALAKLRPIAEAIDAAEHGTSAAAALAAAKPDPAVAKAYATLLGDKPDRNALVALRAAHADDAIVVALVKLDDGTVTDADMPELTKLAAASTDPWIQLIGIEQRGAHALAKGDLAGAETALLPGRALCTAGAPNLRCMKVAISLGRTYLLWQRLPEARAALADAWTRLRAIGEYQYKRIILGYLTNLAAVADDTAGGGLSLVRAYTEELAGLADLDQRSKLDDDACEIAHWGHERVATVLFNQLRIAAAARELAAAPPCAVTHRDLAASTAGLFIRAELATVTASADAIASVRHDLAALRDTKGLPAAERALVDYSDGRIVIATDRAAGEALLRKAIADAAAAPEIGDGRRAVGLSYAVLAVDAAKRNDGKAALAALGEELGVPVRATCVLGVADLDRDAIAVARGADGTDVVDAHERTSIAIDPGAVVPARLADALRACPDVDVLARPPYHGLARILPDDIAWRYVTARSHPIAPSRGESLVVADVEPPATLGLPHLAAWSRQDATVLSGPTATPARVLAAIAEARDVIIHAHGLADTGDASYLALSADADGRYALTAGDVSRAKLASSPLVILAACTAARAAPMFHARWSLPSAFVLAGARAVVAPTTAVPDQDAAAFFAELRNAAGDRPIAVALRDLRKQWLTTHHADWVRDVVVFE